MAKTPTCGYCVPCFTVYPPEYLTATQSTATRGRITSRIFRYTDHNTVILKFGYVTCLTDLKCLSEIPQQTNITVANINKYGADITARIPNEFCLGMHPRSIIPNRFTFTQIPQDRLELTKVCCKGCQDPIASLTTANPEIPGKLEKCIPCCDLLKDRVMNVSHPGWGQSDAPGANGCFSSSFFLELPANVATTLAPLPPDQAADLNQRIQDGIWNASVGNWNRLMSGWLDQTESSLAGPHGEIINPRSDGVTPLLDSAAWSCCTDCPTSCCT